MSSCAEQIQIDYKIRIQAVETNTNTNSKYKYRLLKADGSYSGNTFFGRQQQILAITDTNPFRLMQQNISLAAVVQF